MSSCLKIPTHILNTIELDAILLTKLRKNKWDKVHEELLRERPTLNLYTPYDYKHCFEFELEFYYEDRLPTIYYLLSMAYQSLGNFKEADNFAYKTIELDKKFTKADLLISRSKKYTRDDNHLKQMREKLYHQELKLKFPKAMKFKSGQDLV